MTTFLKYLQYFLIAALSNAMLATAEPQSQWEWARFVIGSFVAGLIAMKAYQSTPDAADTPGTIKITPATVTTEPKTL